MGTLLISKIREEYPDRMMLTFSVVPSPKARARGPRFPNPMPILTFSVVPSPKARARRAPTGPACARGRACMRASHKPESGRHRMLQGSSFTPQSGDQARDAFKAWVRGLCSAGRVAAATRAHQQPAVVKHGAGPTNGDAAGALPKECTQTSSWCWAWRRPTTSTCRRHMQPD